MTKEELLAEKAKLEADIKAKTEKTAKDLEAEEIKALQAEVEALKEKKSKIQVLPPDEGRSTTEMKRAALEKNFEKFCDILTDRNLTLAEKDQKAFESKREKREVRFTHKSIKEIQKEVGVARKDEILDFAKDLETRIGDLSFVAHMLKKDVSDLEMFKDQFGDKFNARDVQMALKALSLGGSTSGAEYVLTGWTDSVAMRLIDSNVALANLPIIDQPHNPYRLPIYTGVPTTYYVTEGSTVSATDPVTGNKDLDAKKLMNRVVYSGELEEDAIVPIRPFVEMVMMESLANGIERNIMFGDIDATANTNINLIDGTPTTTAGAASVYLAIDGLVRETFRTNGKTTDINSDPVAGIATVVQKMGVGALSNGGMGDLLNFMNVELMFKLMGNSNFLTWEKLGPDATLLKGMVGRIYGIPVLPTSGIPKTNSAGKVPNAGGTLGSCVVVKKSSVLVGFKRRPKLEANDILQAADQKAWVASARLALKILAPNAADRAAVSYGYNAGL